MKMSVALVLALLSTTAFAADVYSVTMTLHVPRVYDNTESKGKRQYQRQVVRGEMVVEFTEEGCEPNVSFRSMTNMTHKVCGCRVSYDYSCAEDVRWHAIGSNATGLFKTPSVSMFLTLQPSYVAPYEIDEDNSLILTIATRGTSACIRGRRVPSRLVGYATGTLGCGCKAYGHVSPTRIFGTDFVVDVAAVMGTFKASYKRTE